MIRAARVLALGVVLAATLTACGSGGGGEPTPAATSSSPNAGPSGSPTDDAPGATAPACARDQLTSEFAFTDGTAGQLHGVLSVTNSGGAACGLSGYPTLYVGEPEAEGAMGAAATTDAADPGTSFDLAPGARAVANVTVTQAGNIDGCTIVDTHYVVYAPPGIPFTFETGQHVETGPFPGCRDDDLSIVKVGGFTAA